MAPQPALALRSVTAGYAGTLVLRNVDFEVPIGKVVALLGPNGAGKTTLLRVAAGLVRASSGEVHLAGVDVTREQPHQRARAGLCLVPERRGIFPNLTVLENLCLQVPASNPGVGIERALAAFPILGKRLRQKAGSMSGGEQQMLALSRAFLSEPKVVLVDEVSMGLAPRVADDLFAALVRLRETGAALVLVEQHVSRALGVADRVQLLRRGGVTFSGSPGELDETELAKLYLGA